ncbi:MAG: extracellular solute-binding protein [Pseudomonadota bacterium]
MKTNRIALILFLSIFSALYFYSSYSHAADDTLQFGLSMHGTPRYAGNTETLSYATATAPKGGMLRQTYIGSYDTLNPYALKGNPAQGLQYVNDRLFARVWDEPFSLYPLIAEGYTMPADRSAITITLDPRAVFHDGTPITTADVAFTFHTLRDHGRPNMRLIYARVAKMTVHDSRRITFALAPGFERENVMTLAMMPILSKTWWQGRDFDAPVLTPPNGSGPYRISRFNLGRDITYTRTPDYWAADKLVARGHFNFATLRFDYFRDDTVAMQSLTKGDSDIRRETDMRKWMATPVAKSLQKVDFAHQRAENFWTIMLNTRRPILADLKVRQAIGMVLDADRLNATSLYGLYRRTRSIYPNTDLSGTAWQAPANDTTAALRDRHKQADILLKQAGYVIKNGHRVQQRTNAPLRFEILVGTVLDEKVALSWKQQLAKLGIALSIRTLDDTSFRARLLRYDYDATITYWPSSMSPGMEQLSYWSCAAASQEGRFNYSGLCDKDVDHWAAQLAQTTTRESLRDITRQMDDRIMQSAAFVPLFYSAIDRYFIAQHIGWPRVTPLYGPILETWWHKTSGDNAE